MICAKIGRSSDGLSSKSSIGSPTVIGY
jgi:hypothetical protein